MGQTSKKQGMIGWQRLSHPRAMNKIVTLFYEERQGISKFKEPTAPIIRDLL